MQDNKHKHYKLRSPELLRNAVSKDQKLCTGITATECHLPHGITFLPSTRHRWTYLAL